MPGSKSGASRIMQKKAGVRFPQASTSGCCWWATSKGSIRNVASPGGFSWQCEFNSVTRRQHVPVLPRRRQAGQIAIHLSENRHNGRFDLVWQQVPVSSPLLFRAVSDQFVDDSLVDALAGEAGNETMAKHVPAP
jgi:hypothetical protein